MVHIMIRSTKSVIECNTSNSGTFLVNFTTIESSNICWGHTQKMAQAQSQQSMPIRGNLIRYFNICYLCWYESDPDSDELKRDENVFWIMVML